MFEKKKPCSQEVQTTIRDNIVKAYSCKFLSVKTIAVVPIPGPQGVFKVEHRNILKKD